MTTIEILGILGSALGGGSALGVWVKSRGAAAKAKIEAEPAVLEQVRGIVGDMRAELESVKAEAKSDLAIESKRCDDERAKAEKKHAEQRDDDHRACQEQIALVGSIAIRAHDATGREDDTQVRLVRDIVRRTTTPPGGTPVQPERRGELVPRKQPPPPKRGPKETP